MDKLFSELLLAILLSQWPWFIVSRCQDVTSNLKIAPNLDLEYSTRLENKSLDDRHVTDRRLDRKKSVKLYENVQDLWIAQNNSSLTALVPKLKPKLSNSSIKLKNSQKKLIANHTYAWLKTLFSVMPHRSKNKAPPIGHMMTDHQVTRGFRKKWANGSKVLVTKFEESTRSTKLKTTSPPAPQLIKVQSSHPFHHNTPPPDPLFPHLIEIPDDSESFPKQEKGPFPIESPHSSSSSYYETWMIIIASACFATTLITLCTYWLEPGRFKYPQKPIIYYATCYWILSTVYLIHHLPTSKVNSAGLGPPLPPECRESRGVTAADEYAWTGRSAAIFVLYLYFEVAASLWWVTLALCWYLSAGRKWSREAVRQLTTWYHVVCWTAPALLTIAVLVSNTKPNSPGHPNLKINPVRAYFILIGPLILTLTCGSLLVLAGLLSLKAIKKAMKSCHTSITNLERLTFRISLFGLLYVSFKLALLACFALKVPQHHYSNAIADRQSQSILNLGMGSSGPPQPLDKIITLLPPSLGLILFFSLSSGIFTGIWIFNAKTLEAWSNFFALARVMVKDFLSLALNKKNDNFVTTGNCSTMYCKVKSQKYQPCSCSGCCVEGNIAHSAGMLTPRLLDNEIPLMPTTNSFRTIPARSSCRQHSVFSRQSFPTQSVLPRVHTKCYG